VGLFAELLYSDVKMAESFFPAEMFTATIINTKKKKKNVDHGASKVVAAGLERIHKKFKKTMARILA
jgi:hypothetical protein